MKSKKLKSLEKLVEGSMIASNFIRKNVLEGKEFKDLQYIETLIEWISEESGFDEDVVFQSMENYYNQISEEVKSSQTITSKSLLESLLERELQLRLN